VGCTRVALEGLFLARCEPHDLVVLQVRPQPELVLPLIHTHLRRYTQPLGELAGLGS
jgi:hypothetical protein